MPCDVLEFFRQIGGGFLDGCKQQCQQRKGPLLNPLVEFLHADLFAVMIPKGPIDDGVDAMNEHGADKFAVEFATQTGLPAGIGLMDSENGLELLEEQLDLPTKHVEVQSNPGWKLFGGSIGDQ